MIWKQPGQYQRQLFCELKKQGLKGRMSHLEGYTESPRSDLVIKVIVYHKFYDSVNARRRRKILRILAHRVT